MKFQNRKKSYKTSFFEAVVRDNLEVIKLLLDNDKIDCNIPYISKQKNCYKIFYSINSIIFTHII